MRTLVVPLLRASALLLAAFYQINGQQQQASDQEFAPTVTARCERGVMTIVVVTQQPFHGVVHARDYRKEQCVAYGGGYHNTSLRISLLANEDDPGFCGVQVNKATEKRSVAIAVRVHRALELSEDKSYLVTCGNSGFRNARNELSRVTLNFIDQTNNKRVSQLVYGQQYALRAKVTKLDGQYGIRVKSCVSFAPNISDVQLIDSNGCPLTSFLSPFVYNQSIGAADAQLYSTFRFPNSNKVHVQCDVVLCRGGSCGELQCSRPGEPLPQALPRTRNATEDVQLMASTTAFVLEPGESIFAQASTECTEWKFPWLIGLCICLAILLLVMLIVNIFLCSSLTCTCTKTEVVEKEPSEMEDYDPYRVGWAPSSHYGSRTSLNKHGYTSGGSTLNSTSRSVSNGSDHYAIVHSRPGSRYSQHSSKEPLHRGPGSIMSNGHHPNHYNSRI